MKLSDKLYDVLKFIAQYLLPGCSALYFALARIWNLPNPDLVVGTILAVDTFLGALLGIAVIKYNAARKAVAQPQLFEYPPSSELNVTNLMPKSVYDVLYWTAQIFLPASGTLYLALAGLWGWPYGDQIVATVAAVDTFLGIFLGMSSLEYKKALVANS